MSLPTARGHWREIAATGAVRIYNLSASLVSLVIIARLLGPGGQGTIAAAISWAGLVATIAGLSLGQVSQHRIQSLRKSAWDGRLFGSMLALMLVLTTLAYVFVFVVYLLSNGMFFGRLPASVLVLAFLLLPLLIWDEYSSHLLTAAGQLRVYNRLLVIGRTISLLLMLILVGGFDTGVHGALSASLAGQGLIGIGSLYILWKLHKPGWRVGRKEIKALLSGALRLHPNTIGAFLLASSSVLVLSNLDEKAAVGWYHVAWQMITILTIIPQAATLVLYARIADQGPDKIWPAQKQIIAGIMAIMLVIIAVSYMVGPGVIVVLAGESFSPSGKLFQILLPALLGMSLAQLMAPQWISRGIFVPTSLITFATAAVHLVSTVLLVKAYGVEGAAWATALTLSVLPLLVQGVFGWWCERRYQRSIGTHA